MLISENLSRCRVNHAFYCISFCQFIQRSYHVAGGQAVRSVAPHSEGEPREIGLARQHRLFSVDTISSVRIMGTHHFSQKFNF